MFLHSQSTRCSKTRFHQQIHQGKDSENLPKMAGYFPGQPMKFLLENSDVLSKDKI